MQRVCFSFKVRQDRIDEYKQRHRDIWPEMLAALRESGWRNYSLFMRGDGLVFGYLETNDIEAANAHMAIKEVNRRWQQEMASFFEPLADGRRSTSLVEVFHLDEACS